jgi:hypothetical protein
MSRTVRDALACTLLVLAACGGGPEAPSRREQALEDLAALEAALARWAGDHEGALPETLDPLIRPLPDGRHYLPAGTPAIHDPWGRRYRYQRGEAGAYTLESLGRDGERGGEGENADLGRADVGSAAGR